MADVDPTLEQRVLYVSPGEWEAHVHEHHQRIASDDELK